MILQITQPYIIFSTYNGDPENNALFWIRKLAAFFPTWDPPHHSELLGVRLVQPTVLQENVLMIELPDDTKEDQIELIVGHLKSRGYIGVNSYWRAWIGLYNIGWSCYNKDTLVKEWSEDVINNGRESSDSTILVLPNGKRIKVDITTGD